MAAAEIIEAPEVFVSVIIPTHNRPGLLAKAVASALQQDFPNLEVIVVVDGEDLRTYDVVYSIRDTRLRMIDLAVNVGAAEARNIGVRAAKGEWVAFLDDDDEWLPQKLSRQIEAAYQTGANWPVVSSGMLVRTSDYEMIRPLRRYNPEKSISEYLFCRRSLQDGPFAMQTSTLFLRREMMLAVPFRDGLKRHQDWDWLLRTERFPGVKFAVIEHPLVIYSTEDGRESLSRDQDWKFSLHWAEEMRGFFSAKAYSWFLASECATRAVKGRAGLKAYSEILQKFLLDGLPTLRSLAMIAMFLATPQPLRENLRALIRRSRRNAGTMPSLRRNPQTTMGMEW